MDRGLARLREKKAHINQHFQIILDEINTRQTLLKNKPIPVDDREAFALFSSIDMDQDKEGLALFRGNRLRIWRGNVFDVAEVLSPDDWRLFQPPDRNSLLIRQKASVYLISALPIGTDSFILSYRLLAFLPQYKTPYLQVYHFLPQRLLQNCNIDYWDFRDDISGYERIFSRYEDEYIGQPSPTNKRRTLIFPLRTSTNNIIATVNLTSSPFAAKIATNRQLFTLIFFVLLLLSFFSLLLNVWKFSPFWKRHRFLRMAVIPGLLVSSRFLFFPISELDKVRALQLFSPARASFNALGRFSRSPADIFLTALFALLIILFLALQFRHFLERKRRAQKALPSILGNAASVALSFATLALFRTVVTRIVLNSNLDLFRFSLKPTFLLLHLSIVAFFLCFFITAYLSLRLASQFSGTIFSFLPGFITGFVVIFLLTGSGWLSPVLQGIVILIIGLSAYNWPIFKNRRILIPLLLFSILLTYQTVFTASLKKQQSILEDSLPNLIISHKQWGRYLIEQALPAIELEQDGMLTFFKTARPAGLAQSLWEKTLIAKFNWYSSLELLSPEGGILSRFSLNVPEVFRTDFELPVSADWTVVSHNLSYLGKDNEFLIAYKDWMEEGSIIGRTMLYLSMDYESLPFLFSANPYFEVMRSTSIPSLNQIELGFAVFENTGELYVNPSDIARGIPGSILAEIKSTGRPQWGSFRDKNRLFRCYYFPHDSRIFALFVPVKRIMSHALDFLRLLFLQMSVILLIYAALSLYFQQKFKNPLWSFSNRVYIAFIVVALVPLLIYTLSTRSFLPRSSVSILRKKPKYTPDLQKESWKTIYSSSRRSRFL